MTLNKRAYKGSRDFLPADMRVRDFMFNNMKKTAELFAYEGYDGPLLEEVALYKAKSGEELINDQIYSFTDRGERFVAIRPEMTPTVARMIAGVHKQESKPIRWYSIPNLLRYEKPQRGRVREHWQFNVDIFGANPNLGEIEVFNLIIKFLSNFGATKDMFSILINDRRLVDSVFNDLLCLNSEQSYKLYKVIDKAKKVTKEKLDVLISEIISEKDKLQIFNDYLALKSFKEVQTFIEKNKINENCSEFFDFILLVNQLSLKDYISYDPTIVRGLDYYTGIVFEIFDKHPDNNRAIAGGGAYANLLKIFNEKPLAGFGFGLGDVTLRDFLESHNLLPDLTKPKNDMLIVYTQKEAEIDSINLSNTLRDNGIKTELVLGKIKFNKVFKLAETKGHIRVAVVEIKESKVHVQVKNTESRENKSFECNKINEIIEYIKE